MRSAPHGDPPGTPTRSRARRTESENEIPDPLVATEAVAGRGPASVLDVNPPQTPSFAIGFRALRHRDFRLFFVGQLISLTGTWMQSLAQSWLVLELTSSPLALGIVGAVQFLPVLLLSAIGGVVADRLRKRSVLIATQTVEMLLAFVLAILVVERLATFGSVLFMALLLGIANSIDMPTRQSYVVELVGPEDLLNAIALNSTIFNSARIVGPALGGLLIGVIGLAGCFFLNGLTFIPVIIGLFLIRPSAMRTRHFGSVDQVFRDLREGFQFVRNVPPIWVVVILTGAIGTFGANFNVVTPIMARDTLQVGATGLGWLMAAMGVGSLVASLVLAFRGSRPRPKVMFLASLVFSIAEIALAPVSSYTIALGLFVVIGAAMVTFSAIANSYIQLTVPHGLRGRVMSIYTTVFVGTTPIGNTLAGGIAQISGAFGPLLFGGALSLAATLWCAYRFPRSPPPPVPRRTARHRAPDHD